MDKTTVFLFETAAQGPHLILPVREANPDTGLQAVLCRVDGGRMARWDGAANEALRIDLRRGQRYALLARATKKSGKLSLQLSRAAGESFKTALPVVVEPGRRHAFVGRLRGSSRKDFYRLERTSDEHAAELRLDPAEPGTGELEVTLHEGVAGPPTRIAWETQVTGTRTARILLSDEHATYLVVATTNEGVRSYTLGVTAAAIEESLEEVEESLPASHCAARNIAKACPLTLPASGTVAEVGTINENQDAVYYRFDAPADGMVSVSMRVLGAFDLDPHLLIYGSAKEEIANDDDSGIDQNAFVYLKVQRNRTYYVKAAAILGSGLFRLEIGTGSAASSPSGALDQQLRDAKLLTLSPNQSTTVDGAIESIGAENMYRFVAIRDGSMTVDMQSATDSEFDPKITIYDGRGRTLEEDDDSGEELNARVQFRVVRGETYYIKTECSSEGLTLSKGKYRLKLTAGAKIKPRQSPEGL